MTQLPEKTERTPPGGRNIGPMRGTHEPLFTRCRSRAAFTA